MKILIGYDGSEASTAMLDDLRLAGLPNDIEVLVIAVAEMWLVPPPSYGLAQTNFVDNFQVDVRLATETAEKAVERLKQLFPEWKISIETAIGSPAREILKKAESYNPDLIIVGSQGLSTLGRFFLGSVSQKVATEAHTSVRIARGRVQETDEPARIVIAIDGSPESNAAIRSVANRNWNKGTEVVLLTATGNIAPEDYKTAFGFASHSNTELKDEIDQLSNIKQVLEEALEAQLKANGLAVSTIIRTGDPRKTILEEAEKWGADSIFIGSRGFGRIKRLLLGSVSTAIASRAHCSVEIVRLAEESD